MISPGADVAGTMSAGRRATAHGAVDWRSIDRQAGKVLGRPTGTRYPLTPVRQLRIANQRVNYAECAPPAVVSAAVACGASIIPRIKPEHKHGQPGHKTRPQYYGTAPLRYRSRCDRPASQDVHRGVEMADLTFVDTHVHFWDLRNPDLSYSWLQPGWVHPVLGNIDDLKVPLWAAEHLRIETRNANVSKVVHVQSALGIEDPVQETLWLERAADRTGFPNAIMAYTDLKSRTVEAELDRHAEASGRLRGVRDFSSGDYLVDEQFARGCRVLERYGLVLGFEATWEDMSKAARLAQSVPNTVFMVDHTGWPRARSSDYFASWRGGMSALADADNAWCKISGLGMNDNNWTPGSLRPWVLAAIEIFGVERCVLGTNWPVDKLYSSYDALIDAYAEILSDFSEDEQTALFSGNAERVFRI